MNAEDDPSRDGFSARPDRDTASFGIGELWAMLFLQRKVILGIGGGVMLLVLAITLLLTPQYRARATLHLVVPTVREIADSPSAPNYSYNAQTGVQSFYPTQLEIMASNTLRQQVLERFEALRGTPDDVLTSTGELGRATEIEIRPLTELVDIEVLHPDPERAAQFANLYAEVYQDHNLDAGRDAARDARAWLETQLSSYDEHIDELGREIVEYQEDNDLAEAQQEVSALGARVSAVKTALANTRTQLLEAEGRLAAHEELLREGDLQRLAKQLDTTLLSALTQQYAVALTNLVQLSARYGERHPQRIAAEAAVEKIRDELWAEARQAVDTEHSEVAVVRRNVADLEAEAARLDDAMLAKQRAREGYDRLRSEIERSKDYKVRLAQRMDELDLMARTQLNNARLIQRASAPSAPYSPNLLFNLAVGLPLATVLALGAALIRHQMDETITTPLDITAHLKATYLGTIPSLPNEDLSAAESALYTYNQPHSLMAEAVRSLRTVIDRSAGGTRLKRLMVTSAIMGEGKTDTTVRLAVAFARSGRRVVIVDADLRRPRQHRALGIEVREPGLTDALLEADPMDCVRETQVEGIDLLPAGAGGTHVTELLGSDAMERVLARLEQHYDLVLVDTPPVLLTADPGIVSHHVERIVLVVRARKVPRGAVQHALSSLAKINAPLLGIILNAADQASSIGGGYYGGRYGYYRYGGSYGDPDNSSAAK